MNIDKYDPTITVGLDHCRHWDLRTFVVCEQVVNAHTVSVSPHYPYDDRTPAMPRQYVFGAGLSFQDRCYVIVHPLGCSLLWP